MIEAVEKQNLSQRTRARNTLNWMTMDFGGILAPLLELEEEHDILAMPIIESFIDISDELYTIKEYQRNRTTQMSQEEIAQDRLLAENKAIVGMMKIAIQHETSVYLLAVQVYDAKVKSNLMAVKEYAALVERVALAAERDMAGLAIDKEALHLYKTEAQIYEEYINQAQVEADIAKAQVEVAKANVRAAEAGIAAGEAEIKLINAQTEQYVMAAEKATLQADVAMIFAEIMTKKLAAVKLDVGQKEIVAGFGYIQTKLDDMLTLYDTKTLIEQIKTDAETAMLGEAKLTLAAEEEAETLRDVDADIALEVQNYDRIETVQNIADEAALKALAVTIRKLLSDTRTHNTIQKDAEQTWAQGLVNAAQRYVHKNQVRISSSQETKRTQEELTIGAGG